MCAAWRRDFPQKLAGDRVGLGRPRGEVPFSGSFPRGLPPNQTCQFPGIRLFNDVDVNAIPDWLRVGEVVTAAEDDECFRRLAAMI